MCGQSLKEFIDHARYYPHSLKFMNMEKSPSSSVPTLKISDNLTRAAGVLQDMQAQGKFKSKENIPGSPPALFGAGGPM